MYPFLRLGPGVWRPFALTTLAGLALLYAVAALTWPLGWDHGVFAWIGSTIADGGMPFRDAWDVKGPVSYLPFALVSALGATVPWAYRVVDLLTLVGGALALRSVVRSLGLSAWAPFAALGLVLTQASFGFTGTLQPDHWAGWLLTGAVALQLRRRESPWSLATFGILVGLATLIKPLYAPFVFLPLIGAASNHTGRGRTLSVVLAGAAVPVGLCVVWFAARGALTEFVDGYLFFNVDTWRFKEFHDVSMLQGVRRAASRLPILLPLVPLALVGIVERWHTDRRSAAILGCWFGLAAGVVALQGRWFVYQWAPLVPALLCCGTVALAAVFRQRSGHWLQRATIAALGLWFLGIAGSRLLAVSRPLVALASGGHRIDYLQRFAAPVPEYSAAQIEQVAEVLSRLTDPGECVLVWKDPVVNVLSDRPTPGRFATFVPLTMGALTPRREKYRTEFLNTLIANPPRLILIDTFTLTSRIGLRGELPKRFPAFLDLVQARYRSTGILGKYTVWAARSPERTPCR